MKSQGHILRADYCEDTTPVMLESITEHPDVQRLIKQIVILQSKHDKLKNALRNLVNDVFAGRTPMPKHLYAYKQALKALED